LFCKRALFNVKAFSEWNGLILFLKHGAANQKLKKKPGAVLLKIWQKESKAYDRKKKENIVKVRQLKNCSSSALAFGGPESRF